MAEKTPPKKEDPTTPTARFKAGLEDVVAASSGICLVDGTEGKLLYRGYSIHDLAEHSSFAETAYLLWHGRLPGKKEFDDFVSDFRGSIELPEETITLLRMVPPNAPPMEVIRTAVSSLGHYDPESDSTGHDVNLRKAIRLTARIPSITTAYERILSTETR